MRVAVVCGALRQPSEFASTMAWLLRHRSESRVDHVVLSTWKGELDAHGDTRALLVRSGIELVESAAPIPLGTGNIHAQKKALHQALLRVPADATVLKMRTDKSAVLVDRFVDRLQRPLTSANDKTSSFTNRVVVSRISPTLPFMIDDFAFIGNASDLLKMTQASDALGAFWSGLEPTAEMSWMYPPVARQSWVMERVFATFRIRQLSVAIVNFCRAHDDLPDALKDFLAIYWNLVHGSYEIIHSNEVQRDVTPLSILREEFGRPHVRNVGEYITVTNEALFAAAAKSILASTATSQNDSGGEAARICSGLLELFPNAATGDTVVTIPNAEHYQSSGVSFLDHTLRNQFPDMADAERDIVAQVMTDEGRRLPFQNVLTKIARSYLEGTTGLPVDKVKARKWANDAAAMRDPDALQLLASLHETPQEAVKDPDVMKALAAIGIRNAKTFCILAGAILLQNMDPPDFPRVKLIRALNVLAARGDKDASAILAEAN